MRRTNFLKMIFIEQLFPESTIFSNEIFEHFMFQISSAAQYECSDKQEVSELTSGNLIASEIDISFSFTLERAVILFG